MCTIISRLWPQLPLDPAKWLDLTSAALAEAASATECMDHGVNHGVGGEEVGSASRAVHDGAATNGALPVHSKKKKKRKE